MSIKLLGRSRVYSAQAQALFARMSNQPTASRARLIDTVIRILIAQGVWATLDALYFTAAADAQAASLNWVSSSHNLTAVNSPTFTADRGYAGNGTTSYLDTNLLPGVSATINSHAIGAYMNTATATGAFVGNFGGCQILTNGTVLVTASSAGTLTTTQPDTLGFSGMSRTGAAGYTTQRYTTQTAQTQASAFFNTTHDFWLLASSDSSSFNTARIAAAFIGSGLSGAQLTVMEQQMLYYATAVGAA